MSMTPGRFVWFDLTVPDIDGAKAFYTDIVGWQAEKWPGGDYVIWHAAKEGIGGIMKLTPEMKQRGAPPNWMGYVASDDVDASARRAEKLGGRIIVPGTDIPDTGRFAVVADPQGAVFGLFYSRNRMEAPDATALGNFGWAELNTTDWKAAWKFYSELFGWKKTSSMDMGPELGEYFMFGTDPEKSMGGMSNAANMMKAPAHWLHYANVKTVDDTAKRIAAKGGKILNGPMDVPGGETRIAQCMDPQGAMFAIMASKRR